MLKLSLFTTAITLTSLVTVAESATYSEEEGGTQFIYYNGTISGSFAHHNPNRNNTACGENGIYYFSDLDYSFMRIGANPSWDPNPFYFHLHSYGRLDRQGSSLSALSFATAYFLCYEGDYGDPCGSFEFWPWYYVSAPQLNLSAASVRVVRDVPIVKGGDADGGVRPFYAVSGDERTWISNGTADAERGNWLHFDAPANYSDAQTEQPACVDDMTVYWNNRTNFTYALNFTNTSATSQLVVTVLEGTLTLSFLGKRQDANDSTTAPENQLDFFSPISLADPAAHPMPVFTFTDGKGFDWDKDDEGKWDAKSRGEFVRPGLGRVVYSFLFMCAFMFVL